MSIRFSKNPEIIVEDGKIGRLFMGESCILRGFTFELEVENAMKYLAYSEPSEFMELYLNLTNDETFSKMAKKVYEERIDKNLYPYETMKSLRISDFPSTSDSALRFSCENLHELLIANGLVIKIINNLTTKGSCSRNETDFLKCLIRQFIALLVLTLNNLCNFIMFYKMIQLLLKSHMMFVKNS